MRKKALGAMLVATAATLGCDTPPADPAPPRGDVDAGWDAADGEADDDASHADVADAFAPDVNPDPHLPPTGPRSPDWACNLEERLAACDAPLLHDGASPPTDPADLLYHVNREHDIPADWPGTPNDLMTIPSKYTTRPLRLREVAWDSPAPAGPNTTHDGRPIGHQGRVGFRPMFDAAAAEGHLLYIASAFRSYADQVATFNKYVKEEMNGGLGPEEAELAASTYSAHPGHSEHQLGTTADLVYRRKDGTISPFGQATAMEMAASEAMQWVMDNAHRFGIVLTYGHDKVATTQYVWEPWHWRFVGVEAAMAMHRCDLNTEELLSARYGLGRPGPYAGESLILYDAMAPGPDDLFVQVVDAGQPFTRSVTLTNTGSTNWYGYELRPTASPSFGGEPTPIPCTPRFAEREVTLSLVAPDAPGLYHSEWWLFDAAGHAVAGPLRLPIYVPGQTAGSTDYRFVRLDDLSAVTTGADPGADVDAIVLRKVSGAIHFAEAVASYQAAPAPVAHGDPTEALLAPDAFFGWPDDLSVCDVDAGFVSLGGAGTLIVDMGVAIEEGDTLEVLEVGACSYGSGTAFADPLNVRLSVGPGDTSTWIPLGQLTGGPGQLLVGFLPPLDP